jgi:hypothetical protein
LSDGARRFVGASNPAAINYSHADDEHHQHNGAANQSHGHRPTLALPARIESERFIGRRRVSAAVVIGHGLSPNVGAWAV